MWLKCFGAYAGTKIQRDKRNVADDGESKGENKNRDERIYVYIQKIFLTNSANNSEPFLKWTREEFKQTDLRTRNLMTIHRVLDPRDDVD